MLQAAVVPWEVLIKENGLFVLSAGEGCRIIGYEPQTKFFGGHFDYKRQEGTVSPPSNMEGKKLDSAGKWFCSARMLGIKNMNYIACIWWLTQNKSFSAV